MKRYFSRVIVITLLCLTSGNFFSCKHTDIPKYDYIQMPVIKIETVSTDKNVMSFVTETQSASVMAAEAVNGKDKFLYGDTLAFKEAAKITVIDEYGKTSIDKAEADVKVRGNYTSVSQKKPLKIEFEEKQSMLELHEGKEFKKWVLLSSFKDPSFLRDSIGFDLFKLMDEKYYASDSKLVEVYINNQYWGVYVLAEQQEPQRIDTGYLFEFDSYGWTMNEYTNRFGSTIKDAHGNSYEIKKDFFCSGYSPANNVMWYTLKSKCDDNERNFIGNYMNVVSEICYKAIVENKFCTFDKTYSYAVKDTSSKTAEECISKIIDIDSLVNTYILSEIVCDQDLNYSSFYMSVDFSSKGNKKLTFQAPWDFDSTMGHLSGWCGDLTKDGINNLFADHNSSTAGNLGNGNFWTIFFMQAPWYKEKVIAKWKKMNKQDVLSKLIAQIDSVSNDPINTAAFARDYERWNPEKYYRDPVIIEHRDNEKNKTGYWKTQKDSAEILKEWLNYRFSNLNMLFKK